MTDDREPYGRIFHEQGRLTVNAEREKPFLIAAWPDRTAEQQEIDMRGASAVAVRAVADAELDLDVMRMKLAVLGAHLPAIREALELAVTATDTDDRGRARRYKAALEALGAGEPQERTDEKGADHG